MIINNNIRFRMDNLEGSNFISQDEFQNTIVKKLDYSDDNADQKKT